MTVLRTPADLAQFGVNPLTGEACPLGLRILCDLTEKGRTLVSLFLGAPEADCFPPNWNSMVGEEHAVASILLPRGGMRELMIFALFTKGGCSEVLASTGEVRGICLDDEYRSRYLELASAQPGQYTVHRRPPGLGPAARNIHSFTGRTV